MDECAQAHWPAKWTEPSRVELIILWMSVGAHLAIGTDAAIPFGWFPFVVASLAIAGALLLLRVGILLVGKMRRRIRRPTVTPWIELGSIALILTVVYCTNLGLTARVWLSEGELTEEVKFARAMKTDRFISPHSCGLFTIQATARNRGHGRLAEANVVWLQTVQGRGLVEPPFSLEAGIVYCEHGPPPDTGESHYEHLFGPWWRWLEDV